LFGFGLFFVLVFGFLSFFVTSSLGRELGLESPPESWVYESKGRHFSLLRSTPRRPLALLPRLISLPPFHIPSLIEVALRFEAPLF